MNAHDRKKFLRKCWSDFKSGRYADPYRSGSIKFVPSMFVEYITQAPLHKRRRFVWDYMEMVTARCPNATLQECLAESSDQELGIVRNAVLHHDKKLDDALMTFLFLNPLPTNKIAT